MRKTFVRPPEVPLEDLRAFVLEAASLFKDMLLGDRTLARRALQAHLKPLILKAVETEEGLVLQVVGELDLFSDLTPVMLLAAPQGFEPRYADPESELDS